MKLNYMNLLTHGALKIMAAQFNFRPSLRPYLKSADGWINFSIGITTENGTVSQAIIFHNGKVKTTGKIPSDVDSIMVFTGEDVLVTMAKSTPNEIFNLILKNRLIARGNLNALQAFNFYVSLLMGKVHQKKLDKAFVKELKDRKAEKSSIGPEAYKEFIKRKSYRMQGMIGADPGVKYLKDPFLPDYKIESFPRLKVFLESHFDTRPEICPERPRILTKWFRKNGFERKKSGEPWFPELRQALSFKYLMENRKPIIRENDLIAGTTTSKSTGVTCFPDGQAHMFWGELNSVNKRILNPYICSKETADILHNEVLPFWMDKTFKEYVRTKYDYPVCQQIDERFVAYFVWKSVGISHTIPNFKRVLEQGTHGIIQEIQNKLKGDIDSNQKQSLEAMKICLEGINIYGENLKKEAIKLAENETDPERRVELERLGNICSKVPAKPAETLDEAFNSIWIIWTAVHMENSNTGTSIGRLDQWLQPYFEKDISKLKTEDERKAYIEYAIELAGCFYLRLTDHVPLLPDVANFLFGGSSSTQAITLGGITPDGDDAVNDMTYIFLKVTEILAVRDVNVNARFHIDKNSDNYLKRLCEVNLITSATPIMQGDKAVIKALSQHDYPVEDINDWAATGCVEPTLQGQNFSHTASILLNMVAAMELALNNGYHPLMNWAPGPETGSIENDDFKTFEEFFDAWKIQQKFIIDEAVKLNNLLGEAHQKIRPTPLLSSLIDGTIDSGKDVLHGGAKYNSSGTSNIGLADVTDSLLVIKKIVFDDKKVSFKDLKRAIDTDFENDPALHAMVKNKVLLFGSGNKEAIDMANRVAKVVHDCYMSQTSYRGGRYSAGFWSMSQHVAYGSLSGTLPSGRLSGKPFTPGLTPAPHASKNFLDNISAVSALNPEYMDNNIAFNVKITPKPNESREKSVDTMFFYVKSYFEQGGMQMQFNVVTSEMLKDAVANPENYRNLMVRISGYNAYFVTLNREIQQELIERAEYGL